MKILIVDDSLMDRKLLSRTIEKAGLANEILQAVDVEEGLRLLVRHRVDICLVLLDWQMPKVDGLEFMRMAQKIPELALVPIIMVSASSSEESQRQARAVNSRLAGYVVKPYKAETLITAILPYIK